MQYVVRVLNHRTGVVEKEFNPQHSMRAAERLEDGVNINLNHERFYTDIVKVKDENKKKKKKRKK